MTAPNPVDLLDTVRVRRVELDHARRQRALGKAGYADTCSAEYRLQLALQQAEDAGLLVRPFTVDTAALLHHQDPGDGTYGLAL